MNQPIRRNTWQREAVRALLAELRGFVSAQQLHHMLKEQGQTVGLATVYRALASLAETNEADSIQSPEGETLFRSCAMEAHHHHLVCRGCGDTRELESEVIEEWARSVGREYGFVDIEHVVDLYGLCERCSARSAEAIGA